MHSGATPADVTEARQWHDAFLTHPPLATFMAHKRYLRRLSDEQWDVAVKLLQEGFTLGVIANPNEAVDVVAQAAARWKLPLLAQYDEDNAVVYLALDA